jgi:hypothetical protein
MIKDNIFSLNSYTDSRVFEVDEVENKFTITNNAFDNIEMDNAVLVYAYETEINVMLSNLNLTFVSVELKYVLKFNN